MIVRLQKYLADCGIASRRKAEELMRLGEIRVNGQIVTEPGFKIDKAADVVEYAGKAVYPSEDNIYIMLNKPEGYVTTVKDQFNRPTVLDLIKEKEPRLVPVGRLDYNTSGLLLLTNDGGLVYKLTHPKHNIEKAYIAKVSGIPAAEGLNKLCSGVIIDGYKTAPAKARILRKYDKSADLMIVIHEGKNRQVRKMCDSIGHKVLNLNRMSIGELSLDRLKKGEYRYLTDKEIRYLKSL